MSDKILPTEHEKDIAFQGLLSQIEARDLMDLYLTDERFFGLIQHMVDVLATERAQQDWLRSLL
jgi:hypothetical protein